MTPIESKLDDLRIDRPDPSHGGSSATRIWIALAGVGVVAAILAFGWYSGPKEVEVRTALAREVALGGGQTVLNASGYVTARRQATVSSKVTGKVIEVWIEEGMEVEQGQILARLDDSNVGAALRLSEAQLEASRKEVEETRVRLQEARLDLRRTENLMEEKISSQADLDKARAEVDSLAARLETRQETVKVGERQVDVGRQSVADMVIRAPFSGIVVTKDAQPGEMISPVSAGGGFTRTGIGTLVDMSSLEIEVDVNESYIHRVNAGQRVEAMLDAYPDWKIPCGVIAIVPTADRQTATVRVRIAFDDPGDPRVLPDMGVKVAFLTIEESSKAKQAVAIPRSAIRAEGDRDVVLVMREGLIERRAVTLSSQIGEEALVLAGLAAGERVVFEGPADLKDGDVVKEMK